jgi:hypothetical protein
MLDILAQFPRRAFAVGELQVALFQLAVDAPVIDELADQLDRLEPHVPEGPGALLADEPLEGLLVGALSRADVVRRCGRRHPSRCVRPRRPSRRSRARRGAGRSTDPCSRTDHHHVGSAARPQAAGDRSDAAGCGGVPGISMFTHAVAAGKAAKSRHDGSACASSAPGRLGHCSWPGIAGAKALLLRYSRGCAAEYSPTSASSSDHECAKTPTIVDWLKKHEISEVECLVPDLTAMPGASSSRRTSSSRTAIRACPRVSWCRPSPASTATSTGSSSNPRTRT